MKRLVFGLGAFAAAAVLMSSTAVSQPPGGGGPGGRGGDRRGGPGRFEIGKVLPPFVADHLGLTDDQKTKLAALEADVKKQIAAILTADQMKKLETAGPMGGGPGGRGGERGGKGGPPDGKGKKGDGRPDKE